MKSIWQHRIITGFLLVVCGALGWFGYNHYRTSIRCKQRVVALQSRVEEIKREAHDKLKVGTKRDDVIRFFATNNIPLTFGKFVDRNEATGTIYVSGTSECASLACGTDATLIGLRVDIDEAGTVVSEPVIVSIYTDCL